jgi:hypothetical protein
MYIYVCVCVCVFMRLKSDSLFQSRAADERRYYKALIARLRDSWCLATLCMYVRMYFSSGLMFDLCVPIPCGFVG